jgi:hypothetical protein
MSELRRHVSAAFTPDPVRGSGPDARREMANVWTIAVHRQVKMSRLAVQAIASFARQVARLAQPSM